MKHKRHEEAAAAALAPGGEKKGCIQETRKARDLEKRRQGGAGKDEGSADECKASANKKRPKAPLPRRAVCVARGFLQPVCSYLHLFLPWLRRLKGWSLDDVATITHLDKSYLCDLENRKESNPTLDVISRLAAAFGLKLDHFLKQMVRFATVRGLLKGPGNRSLAGSTAATLPSL